METPGEQEGGATAGGSLPRRLRRLLAGRPLSVYGILLAGAAVLALLLVVVVLTSRPDRSPRPQGCLDVDLADAERSIRDGRVSRIDVLTDRNDVAIGPVLVTLDPVAGDDSCRQLPQGVAAQPDLYRLIGYAATYNQTRPGEARIEMTWRTGVIPPRLLATATPTPTVTPVPLPTEPPPVVVPPPIQEPTAPIIPPPTPSPAATATATATALPSPTAALPVASPTQATPLASPVAATPALASPLVPVLPLPGGGSPGPVLPGG